MNRHYPTIGRLRLTHLTFLSYIFFLLIFLFLVFSLPLQAQKNSIKLHNSDAQRYIIVLNDTTTAQVSNIIEFNRERNQLRQEVISDYSNWYGLKALYEYSSVFNGFTANLSNQAYAGLFADIRVDYIEADENQQEQAYPELVNRSTINIDVSGNDLSSTEDHSSVTIYLLGRGAKPSRPILKSRIVSGVNLTGQGGLNHWRDCNERNRTAFRLARESKRNRHQISLYPIKVSSCSGETSWSKIVAGLDWVMSRNVEQEGVIDVPVSSERWSGMQSVTQAINSLTELGFIIVDRGDSHSYRAEGVTSESVSKPIADSLRLLKKKKKRALKRRQKYKSQNGLGSNTFGSSDPQKKILTNSAVDRNSDLASQDRKSNKNRGKISAYEKSIRLTWANIINALGGKYAMANHLPINPNFNPPISDILAFAPMLLNCVPQFNTTAAIFHGCTDWHSSVHGNWGLLWSSRVANDPSLRNGILNRYTTGNVNTELNNVIPSELTYGFAWFLALAHEAEQLGNTALRPLADYFYSELLIELDRNTLPTSGGTSTALLGSYDNNAWAMFHAYQWAEYINDTVAQNMLIQRVNSHYANVNWSQSYTDFFDAKYLAAMMMVKMNITGSPWSNLLAAIANDSLAVPPVGGGTSHSEGVVSARAWGLWALYVRTGNTAYLNAYNVHTASNLSSIPYWTQSYINSHWLGQFALYSLQMPEVLPLNTAPTANAGSNQTITLPNNAVLSGSTSDDGLPNPPASISTAWGVVSGPGSVTFGNASSVNTTSSFGIDGIYVLRLTATDSVLSSSDDIQITVNPVPVNTAPLVNAGVDQTGDVFSGANLSGAVSDDGLPNPPSSLMTTWSVVSGPGSVVFGNASSVNTTSSFGIDGTYVLRLTATDSVLSSSDDIQITVTNETEISVDFTMGLNLLINTQSGQCLDNLDGSTLSVYQQDCANQSDQIWNIQASGEGYTIVNELSGKCLDVWKSSEGGQVAMWNCHGGNNQLFDIVPSGSGYAIIARWSSGRCIEISGSGHLINNTCNGSEQQNWNINEVLSANTAPLVNAGVDQTGDVFSGANLSGAVSDDGLPNPPSSLMTTWSVVSGPGSVVFGNASSVNTTSSFGIDGTYVLRLTATDSVLSSSDDIQITVTNETEISVDFTMGLNLLINTQSGQCLDNLDGSTLSVYQQDCANQSDQIWNIQASGEGYTIVNELSGKCLDVWKSSEGGQVAMWNCHGGNNQLFDIVPSGSGYAIIARWSSGRCIEISGSGHLINNTCNGSEQQNWNINEVLSANTAPLVNAGVDQTGDVFSGANLSGAVSDDGLPNPPSSLMTTWSVVSGPGSVVFGNASSVNTTSSFGIDGTYVLRLTATDSVLSSSDDIQITVTNETEISVDFTMGLNLLINTQSGQCLDNLDGSTLSVYQQDCANQSDQIWNIQASGEGYTIVNELSGKCLDVWKSSEGGQVAMWNCHGGNNQLFDIVPSGSGYAIIARWSSGRCIEISGSGHLINNTCNGSEQQNWNINEVL